MPSLVSLCELLLSKFLRQFAHYVLRWVSALLHHVVADFLPAFWIFSLIVWVPGVSTRVAWRRDTATAAITLILPFPLIAVDLRCISKYFHVSSGGAVSVCLGG